MTASQRIKRDILVRAIAENDDLSWHGELTEENIDEAYENLIVDPNSHPGYAHEFRTRGVETGISCKSCRHYESKSVGCQLSDGTWVGWVFWFGGGITGDPDSIDWIEDAYDLDVVVEEKLAEVKTFSLSH